jgi:hypothetical protein
MHFNQRRLDPGLPHHLWEKELESELVHRRLEGYFVEAERQVIADLAAQAPSDPDGFIAWFEALRQNGPGQNDALFPWLAEHATRDQLCWFLSQEVAGEAGFEDLLALTQLKMPVIPKLEMGRNFWDELGRGHQAGMHGPMLQQTAQELQLAERGDEVVWESVALSNLMIALAANRRYAYQAVGALGAIEMTAPGRVTHVHAALKRHEVGGEARRYFALHATLDVKHSAAWNAEVLRPLVTEDPLRAQPLAEGALLRMAAGARCFARYRAELGLAAAIGN